MPLADELHAELVNAAFTWYFNAFRLVEQQAFVEGLVEGRRRSTYSPFLHLAVLAIGSRYRASSSLNLSTFICSTISRSS